MIDWLEVENKLHAWAKNISGREAIWENQTAPQPVPPYISLKITNVSKDGYDDVRYKDDKHYLCGLRRITLSVQVYGQNSLTILTKLKDSLEMQDIESDLKTVGLGTIEATDILDTTVLIDTVWEGRHSMDVMFNLASNVEIPDSIPIESVGVEGTIHDGHTGSHDINI